MKNSYRTFSPAIIAAALALLAATPQAASAQAVGGYMRGGAISQPGGAMPAPSQIPSQVPSQAPQFSQPMRSGAIFGRSGGSFGSSPSYSQPTSNQPNFNRPVFSQPAYGGQSYGNAPGYGGQAYGAGQVYGNAPAYNNNAPAYGNSQSYQNERSSGPVVTLPDAAEGRPYGGGYRVRPGRFSGSQAGSPGLSGYPFAGRGGSTLSGDFRPIRPIGSGRGYAGDGGTDLRITTPQGPQFVPPSVYRNTYVYNNYNNSNNSTTIVNAPPLLGGYYYGSYCDTYVQATTYPSIYSAYVGFPQYIFNSTPNVIIVGQPMYQPYITPYLPFDTPSYSVTYNQNNYYVASEDRVREIEGGGAPARAAIKNAYPADSYQAAFADIAKAWTEGDIAPLKKHVRDSDTRISVFLNKKYSYSIASGDFAQITRDALDRLHTVSFDLTRLRKSKTGDVTAYGTHVYRTGAAAAGTTGDTATVPFDQNGADPDNAGASPYDKSGDPAAGVNKTVYVSYTLRHRDGQWYIVEVDSSDHDLVPVS